MLLQKQPMRHQLSHIIAEYRTDLFKIQKEDSGLMVISPTGDFPDHIDVTREMIDEIAQATADLCGNKPVPLLFLFDEAYVNITNDVREYIVSHAGINAIKLAEAIVTSSLASVLLVNIYLAVNRPPKPAKLFRHEAKARKWLLSFLDKQ